jgi:hypothetical protein
MRSIAAMSLGCPYYTTDQLAGSTRVVIWTSRDGNQAPMGPVQCTLKNSTNLSRAQSYRFGITCLEEEPEGNLDKEGAVELTSASSGQCVSPFLCFFTKSTSTLPALLTGSSTLITFFCGSSLSRERAFLSRFLLDFFDFFFLLSRSLLFLSLTHTQNVLTR